QPARRPCSRRIGPLRNVRVIRPGCSVNVAASSQRARAAMAVDVSPSGRPAASRLGRTGSAGMTSDELPDIALRETFLFLGILLGPGRFRRNASNPVAHGQEAADRLELLGRTERPEPGHILEDHLGLTRELDGQLHGRLLNREGSPSDYNRSGDATIDP